MTKRIFRSMIVTAGAVLLATLVIIMGCLYEYFCGVQEQQLKDELSLAAAAMQQGEGETYLQSLNSDRYRLTWVAADGTVLYDTRTDAETMENHAQRQEIQQALLAEQGESSRYSSTLLEKTLYQAQRLEDGSVLRISISRATAGVLVLGMLQPLLVVLAVALILSALLARRVARHIVKPLNELDLEHPLDNDTYEELSPLLGRINQQRRQIDAQLRELQRKRDEFDQVTGSMQEGLVLLNERGEILSINPAAQTLFRADGSCVGQDFLTIERSGEVSRRRSQRDPHGAGWPGIPAGYQPHPVRRRRHRRGGGGLRCNGAGAGTAQPAGVHRQCVPRAENPAAIHHGQRRADAERTGEAGGYAGVPEPHP